jgi:hypothetical protein
MQFAHDERAFDWIRLGRKEMDRSKDAWRVGYSVAHLMPPVFEAYSKILHCIEGHYENIDNPLSPSEISILKIPPCEEVVSLIESRRANAAGSRVRWRDLAEVLNVPFAAEINHKWYLTNLEEGCWSRFLYGPATGWLDAEERGELISFLKPFTDGGEWYFRFSGHAFLDTGKPLLFHGALNELEEFLKTGHYRSTPEYWWFPNESVCVCSDYDLVFTIVGGPRKLISSLLTSSVLECLEVTPQTRIDDYAPPPQSEGRQSLR